MKLRIGEMIRNELRSQERTVAWFSRQICCTRQHAYKIFEKDNLDIMLLMRISKALHHDFFKDISQVHSKQFGDTSVTASATDAD